MIHPQADAPLELDLGRDAFELERGIYLISSSVSRSTVYHHIKRQIGSTSALLVAALSGEPKFKGMKPGTTRWVRERIRRSADLDVLDR